MANFTQLNLEPASPRDPRKDIRNNAPSKPLPKSVTTIGGGILMAAVFLGVLLLGTNGCSKSEKTQVTTPANQNLITAPVTRPAVSTPTVAAQAKAAKKKHTKIRKMATYSDATYGVSFRYPDNYILKTGDEPQKDVAGLGPIETDFVQPGGTTLAAVELPRNAYPGSDVSSAYFSVSVNPNLSEAECAQFSSLDASAPEDDQPVAKVGSLEFNQTEETLKDFDSKYYHTFQNGTCYEFGLGLGNVVSGDKRELTEAEYEKVFDKLGKILVTVRITPGVVPESAQTAPPAASDGKN
jgi:hypothetical protein